MEKIKVKLLITIDEWDKYTEDWDINSLEAIETQINKEWYIETNKDISDYLINNNMAELINN